MDGDQGMAITATVTAMMAGGKMRWIATIVMLGIAQGAFAQDPYRLPSNRAPYQPGDIRIPPGCRIGNPDGRCFGAALEDCARYLGFRSLYRVSDEFKGGAHFIWTQQGRTRYVLKDQISNVLTKRGWKRGVDWDETWTRDPRWLEERLQAGFPCVVSFGPDHGVCLCSLTATQAHFVDNDGMQGPGGFRWANSDRYLSREQFLRQWRVLGWAICLYHEPERDRYYVPGPSRRVPVESRLEYPFWRYDR